MVEAAVTAAKDVSRIDKPTATDLDRLGALLFVLGLTMAHELVHVMVGRIVGPAVFNTPKKVKANTTVASSGNTITTSSGMVLPTGESGSHWEWDFFNKIRVEPYQNSADTVSYSASLYCLLDSQKSQILHPSWVRAVLRFGTYLPTSNRHPDKACLT
jgi:hypothetical protein